MREQLETFVKNRRGLAIAIVIIAALAFIFVVPKAFASLDQGGKKTFWVSFLPSFGIMMLLLFPRKKYNAFSFENRQSAPLLISIQNSACFLYRTPALRGHLPPKNSKFCLLKYRVVVLCGKGGYEHCKSVEGV